MVNFSKVLEKTAVDTVKIIPNDHIVVVDKPKLTRS